MADNPGLLVSGHFHTLRPGTVVIPVQGPITGFHEAVDSRRFGKGGKGERINAVGRPAFQSGQIGVQNKGILINGWYDTFWKNRVHIIPTDGYELGNIVSPQQRTVEVYNAGESIDHVRTVNNILTPGANGFQFISGNLSVPYQLGAHESSVYIWEVSEDGTPTLNMTIDFEFADGVVLTNFITGSRLVMFGYEPQAAMTEVLEWYTDILEKERGIEQRNSTRDVATRSLTRQFFVNDEDGIRFEMLLWDWMERQLGLPAWEDQTTLTTLQAAGSTSLTLADSVVNTEFRDGGLAVIFVANDDFESVTINTATGTTLNLANPTLSTWPAGTLVMPMNTTVMRDNIQQDLWVADGLRRFTITFDVLERIDQADETGFTIYRGAPVWEDGLFLSATQYNRTFSKNIIRARAGKATSNFVSKTRRTETFTTLNGFTIYAEDRAALQRIRAWLDARRGRQKSFWLPTSKRDMVVSLDNVIVLDEIAIESIGYERFIEAEPGGRRDIRIEYVDGSVDYRRIVSSETITEGERLFLDTATSQVYSAANVERLSFLQLVRQNVDKISIEFSRLDDAIINIPLIEVVDE